MAAGLSMILSKGFSTFIAGHRNNTFLTVWIQTTWYATVTADGRSAITAMVSFAYLATEYLRGVWITRYLADTESTNAALSEKPILDIGQIRTVYASDMVANIAIEGAILAVSLFAMKAFQPAASGTNFFVTF
jgi:hypothetical protein